MNVNAPPEVTTQEAVRFALQNGDHLEMLKVMAEFVSLHPDKFFALVPEVSPGALSGRLAKAEPELFMKLASRHVTGSKAGGEILQLMVQGEKVPAIKLIRQAWGFGLKEAKDVSDKVHDALFTMGKMQTRYGSSIELTGEMLHAFKKIMEHA